MKNFFFISRLQNVMPVRARCVICQGVHDDAKTRDLDFKGRFVCDDCFPHVLAAEKFLRRTCRLDFPSDALLEQHL